MMFLISVICINSDIVMSDRDLAELSKLQIIESVYKILFVNVSCMYVCMYVCVSE